MPLQPNLEEVLDLDSRGCQFESDQGYHFYKEFIMNFIRYEKTQLVIGDSDPKKLQNMVDGYRHKGYNVSNDLNQMFNRYKTSRPVYYKIISLQHQLNRAPGFEPGGWRFESFQRGIEVLQSKQYYKVKLFALEASVLFKTKWTQRLMKQGPVAYLKRYLLQKR